MHAQTHRIPTGTMTTTQLHKPQLPHFATMGLRRSDSFLARSAVFVAALASCVVKTSSFVPPVPPSSLHPTLPTQQHCSRHAAQCILVPRDANTRDDADDLPVRSSTDRRVFLETLSIASASGTLALIGAPSSAEAAFADTFTQRTGEQLYVLPSRGIKNATSFVADLAGLGDGRTIEESLLKLLPVQNRAYKSLQKQLVDAVAPIKKLVADAAALAEATEVSINRSVDDKVWRNSAKAMGKTLKYFDSQRSTLVPLFNEDDSTEMTVLKSERGEQVIGKLRDGIQDMVTAVQDRNITAVFSSQRKSLFALAETGELLVPVFPYDVPATGKFANLPRLQGRTRVTFTMKRGNDVLGNITIVADGFAAPITAGNFVDLCARNFYTGLPIKSFSKRLGVEASESSIDETVVQKDAGELLAKTISNFNAKFGTNVKVEEIDDGETLATTVPIWGSYQEGFYDPLTAKPRRIPLEIVQEDEGGKGFKLAYAGGFAKLPGDSKIQDNTPLSKPSASRPYRPALTFDIPGIVALNHPDKYLNGGSSEFFSIPEKELSKQKTKLLDGQYAPFGYVTEGYNLFASLKAGDIIAATDVSEFGRLNLVRVRESTFGDILKSSSDDEKVE